MNKCPQCRLLVQDGLPQCPNCGATIPGVIPRVGSAPAGEPRAREPLGPPTTPATAIVGFILALLPIFCLNFVGVILGIIALVKISDQPRRFKGKGLAIAAIVIGVLWFFVGVLAAIAIPNFIKFQARAKQSEAKVLLKQVQLLQGNYFEQHERYATTFEALGMPLEVRHYAIFMADDSVQPAARYSNPEPTYANETGYRAVAVGNLDSDETLDVWAVDHGGQVEHVVDDLEY